jgi:phosphatidylserine/phosphatidylglycerophosphate/cardiolipin synthase-like enzyme
VIDFVRPARAVALELISGKGHYDSIVQRVMQAKTSVWISTANLKEMMVEDTRPRALRSKRPNSYRSVLDVFDELSQKGVELRLLHASLPSRPFREEFDKHPRLIGGGMELRMCPRVHMKTVIVDAQHVYLGSANWTGAGLGAKGEGRRNFEVGIWSTDEGLVDEVQAIYDTIWRGAGCRGCKLREECEAPLDGEKPKKREPVRALVKVRRRPPR